MRHPLVWLIYLFCAIGRGEPLSKDLPPGSRPGLAADPHSKSSPFGGGTGTNRPEGPDLKCTNTGVLTPSVAEVPVTQVAPDGTKANGSYRGLVTEEYHYPTPFVLESLGLGAWEDPARKACVNLTSSLKLISPGPDLRQFVPPPAQLAKLNVVSLGEGFSGFGPFVVGHGANFAGLDLPEAYSKLSLQIRRPRPIKVKGNENLGLLLSLQQSQPVDTLAGDRGNYYLNKWGRHLIPGDALKLSDSVASGSQDFIVAHKLLNNLDSPDDRRKVVTEGFKALASNGQFHFDIPEEGKTPTDQEVLAQVKALTKDLPANDFDVTVLRGNVGMKARPKPPGTRSCYTPDSVHHFSFSETIDNTPGFKSAFPLTADVATVSVIVRKRAPNIRQ